MFSDSLQIFLFVMINNQIEQSGWLKQIGFGASFSGGRPNAIHDIGLHTKELCKDGNDDTCFSILYCSQYYSFGMKIHGYC